jgi:hypothetical protein
MVSISWKSVQSGTLYLALIPSARVFNSEQAESRIGATNRGIDGCKGGRRPDFLCPARQFGSFVNFCRLASVVTRLCLRAVVKNRSIRFVPSFLRFGFGRCPGRSCQKRNASGPLCNGPDGCGCEGTAVFPENSGSPQKFARCASRGETNNSIRFVPSFFAGPVSCPSPGRDARSATLRVRLRASGAPFLPFLYSIVKDHGTAEHPRAVADGHADSHDEYGMGPCRCLRKLLKG